MCFDRKLKINRDLFKFHETLQIHFMCDRYIQNINPKFNHISTFSLFMYQRKMTLTKFIFNLSQVKQNQFL